MRRALTLLAALALGAAPLGAHATTAPTLTLTQQARKADVIVRATLGTPTNVTEGEAIWTVYPLTVTETVAGDPATLPQREGRPVLYVLQGLEDLPELRAGQEAFLLLYSRRMDNPVVGFAQGVYPVVNGRVTRPGDSTGARATTASGPATPSGSATTTTPGAPTSTTPGTATSPPAPGTTPPTTTPGSDAATATANPAAGSTPAPGSGTTTTTTTAPGTTGSTTTSGAGATNATPATSSAPASGSTTSTPASGAATSTSTPGNAAPATATPTPVNDPNAIPSDPARFRDALRAAREGR
ncbi:hypothetical protein DAETH_07060 [Deinococcus aetherius]|uniref:Uncharacterized protein n=1 Tax=Deinococcus aetherius TaxID=200252 RepID=A0ABM8AAF7_9DEIO|nr:hypothetical protein [Deinococcus aetherius]BDP40737.1 hypothetical protein DAETH_07060 [Deinococcus aetherius]